MLTLRRLLTPFDARLLAGAVGEDAEVRWAHTSELIDPTPFLTGGELLLTNAVQIVGEELQRAYVQRLVDKQLAGLGIGTGANIAEVPPAMIEAAEALGFPLYEIPYEVPFIAITEQAFREIADEQNAVLRSVMWAHEQLEQLVLREAGLQPVVQRLAQLVEGSVLLFDARGRITSRADAAVPVGGDQLELISAEVRERCAGEAWQPFVPAHADLDGRALALPVSVRRSGAAAAAAPQAWIVAAKTAARLSEYDRLVLRHGVTVVALELVRQRVARDTEWRLTSSLMADLATGRVAGSELARKLEGFGLDSRVAALVIEQPDTPSLRGDVCEAALIAALAEEPVASVVAPHKGVVVALVQQPPRRIGMRELAARVRTNVVADLGVPVRVGVGRPVELVDARRTFHEARCALEAAVMSGRDGEGLTIATHEDLGSFRFILALQDDEELRQFWESVLGPLLESKSYADELLRSLEVYLEEGGHWERSSARLFCHRHTLRYRMQKIEELTGRSMSSANDRSEFWLALRARRLSE